MENTFLQLNEKFIWSAWDGDINGMEEALALGADVNYCNERSPQSALMLTMLADNSNAVDLLMEYKINIELTDSNGETVLCRLCDNQFGVDYLKYIKMLLSAGANVNHQDSILRHTPLTKAIMSNHTNKMDVIQVLLQYGADPLIKDKDGENTYNMAQRIDRQDVIDFIRGHQHSKNDAAALHQMVNDEADDQHIDNLMI